MADVLHERIDMAVFAAVPDYERISLLISDFDLARGSGAAAGFLRRMSQRACSDDARAGASCRRWLRAYEAVGLGRHVTPPQEALLAWARSPGGVPTQGTLCDLANAFSLLHDVPTAAYDIGRVEGDLWLCPSRGIERFEPLGGGDPIAPDMNELILVDSAGTVLARHWNGAQGKASVVSQLTSRCLVHIDLLPGFELSSGSLGESFSRLAHGFVGGEIEAQVLSRAGPTARWQP